MYYVSAPIITAGLDFIYDGINPLCMPSASATIQVLGTRRITGTLITASYTSDRGGGITTSLSSSQVSFSSVHTFTFPATMQVVVKSTIFNQINGFQIIGNNLSRLRVGTSSAGGIIIAYSSGSVGAPIVLFQNGLRLPPNEYVLAATVDSNQTWNVYVNGIRSITNVTSSIPTGSRFEITRIGIPFAGSTLGFPGNIYHIGVYNRDLSENEVIQNYNALKTRFNLT